MATPDFDESTSLAYELGYKGLFLDRRLGVENDDFRVVAYADNLTDEEYLLYGMGAGGIKIGRPGRGREVGIKFTVFL